MQYIITIAKVAAAFTTLWAVTRLLSRHFVRRVTLFDFISAIVLGSLAATVISQGAQPAQTLLSLVFWGALALLLNWLDLQRHEVQVFFNGQPVVLIENGQVMEENLRKQRLPLATLESLLRYQGYFDISKVEFAVLETSGHLSVLPKSQYRPLTASDIGQFTKYEGLSTQVVHEGQILKKQLQGLGLDKDWLEDQLAQRGLTPSGLFAAWVTSDGRVVVDAYEDHTQTGQHAYSPPPSNDHPIS